MNGAVTRPAVLLGAYLAAHLAQYGLFLLSWLLLGRAALAGTVSGAVIAQWALMTGASLLFGAATTWLGAELAVTTGRLLRGRLLRGALALDTSTVRREGTSHLLGRVLETESIEDLAVGGALRGLASLLHLTLAATVLGAALRTPAPAFLLCWLIVAMTAARRYTRTREEWTTARTALGNDLTEKIAGYRTRAVQQRPERLHDGEHDALAAYVALARTMDRRLAVLTALVPRGWALTAMALLFVSAGSGADRGALAAGAMGVPFTSGALTQLTGGLVGLADALCARTQLRPLLAASGKPAPGSSGAAADSRRTTPPPAVAGLHQNAALIEAEAVGYRYPGQDRDALHDVGLRIHTGDRVLVQGPSGSGKSTLAALLSGSRQPTTGHLRHAPSGTGAEPGRRVLTVPQADHNHVFLDTLAMHLLLGRAPSSDGGADLAAAERTCRTLDESVQMPAGTERGCSRSVCDDRPEHPRDRTVREDRR